MTSTSDPTFYGGPPQAKGAQSIDLLLQTELHRDITMGVFLQKAAKAGLLHSRYGKAPRPDEHPVPPPDGEVLASSCESGSRYYAWWIDATCLVSLRHEGGTIHFVVCADSIPHAETIHARILREYSISDTEEQNRVPVTFWFNTVHGPNSTTRTLDVIDWSSIRGNYTESVQEDFDQLVSLDPTSIPGRIVFWHGHPGTGKTYALRALAWEWRRWCSTHYIIDPDSLLGKDSAYLAQLLIEPGTSHPTLSDEDASDADRWRLFVLEDAGELIASDARQDVGQALSRLLNIADGLLGQGLRVLILVSTNEDIGTIHEAVLRPGRRLGLTEFTELSEREVREWFERQESELVSGVRGRLADMYDALSTGAAPSESGSVRPPRQVGFAPSDLR